MCPSRRGSSYHIEIVQYHHNEDPLFIHIEQPTTVLFQIASQRSTVKKMWRVTQLCRSLPWLLTCLTRSTYDRNNGITWKLFTITVMQQMILSSAKRVSGSQKCPKIAFWVNKLIFTWVLIKQLFQENPFNETTLNISWEITNSNLLWKFTLKNFVINMQSLNLHLQTYKHTQRQTLRSERRNVTNPLRITQKLTSCTGL